MERLTYWNEDHECWSYHGPSGNAAIRLATYEDTGLEPEEIKTILERYQAFRSAISDETGQPLVSWTRASEICRAEKDGRLVVLPCKVGDRVYRVITARDAAPVMTEIEIKTFGQAADLIGRIGEKQLRVSWYLTREEAEAALKKRED